MDNFELYYKEYLIHFCINKSKLNINIDYKNEEGKDKSKFTSVSLRFENNFRKFISDFSDLLMQIKEKIIEVNLKEFYNKYALKYLKIEFNKFDKIFISEEIYRINTYYYLTKGINHERINSIPFVCSIKKESINIDNILQMIDNENLFNCYNLDHIRYFNNDKGVFQVINGEEITIKEKNIFEFHIKERKNSLIENLRFKQNYLVNEIIKIKNIINKISDKVQKYDLVYLYASPIIGNENYEEFNSPISYMTEIRNILEIIKQSGKKFNCKIKCAD